MGENRNYKKLIASCATVLCMAVVMILTVFYTDASDESTAIKYQEGYTWESKNYKDDKGAGIAPEAPEGYLFAGWYTKEGTTYKPVSNPVENANYYAKFVPEKVLGMKAQISKTLTDDNAENDGTTAAIRFVTSIDNSKAYKHVGFNIKKGSSGTAEDAKTTDYVYRTIYAVGATDSNGKAEDYVPEELFHEASYYFKTWTIGNIKEAAYNTEITVIPYWITLDGTRVEGTKAIKVATINLGRSWIYINETANEDGKQYGTKKHPYNDFATALDNIVIDKNGKILLQSDYKEASSFKWNSHGKDIIIAGVQGNETLDFSQLSAGSINDGVTFASMTLKLRSGNVYACGNNFTIAEDVVSDNPNTVIYGGAYGTTVKETNVTILTGQYKAIYGGGAVGGTVTEDTHVIIKNTNISNTSTSHDSRVHGGGNKATVKGNTYVTIGAGFNAELNYESHTMDSTVYGGGYGENKDGVISTAMVEGDTYVYVQGGAKANYIFGAGGPYSTVEGTSHIYFEEGYAMGLYGGANGSGTNSHTSVVMLGGQVDQIFGGNQGVENNSITGNTDVQVLGGEVTRRIYGGCYNEYKNSSWKTTNSVEGYTSVTIASEATVPSGNVCANSRLGTKSENEIGVLVLNQGIDSGCIGRDFGSSLCTNFLVEVPEGGTVTSENGLLNIATDTGNGYNFATVTYAGETLCIVEGKGKCPLPTLNNTTSIQDIEVTFSKESPTIDGFEAKSVTGTDVVYYPTFEEAMDMAEDGTNVVVLKDIEISETYTIVAKLTISSEKEVTLTRASGVTGNLFEVKGELHISGHKNGNLILDGAYADSVKDVVRAVNVASGATLAMDYATIQSFYTKGDGAAVYVHEGSEATLTECIFQSNQSEAAGGAIFIAKASSTDIAGKVTSENSSFIGNTATGNGGAIHCKGTYIDKNCNYTNNTGKNGGALVVFDGGSVSLTGNNESALFSNNRASGDSNSRGAAIFVNGSKSSLEVSGYVFEQHSVGKGIIHVISNGNASLTDIVFQNTNEVKTINVLGTLTFDNITGATLVQDSAGKIYVAGYEETNALSVTPYTNTDTYTVGHEVLVRAEGVEELVFEAACAGITVTPDGSGNDWWIKSDGTLIKGEARIGETYYNTISEALTNATDSDVIYILKDIELDGEINIATNLSILNEPGQTISISRGAIENAKNMFNVGNGSSTVSLTLGTNDKDEKGKLIVNGATTTPISGKIVDNKAKATFTLGSNATLQGAFSSGWGVALTNRGTANLYGSVLNNNSTGYGGAILQTRNCGKLIIYEGIYSGNVASSENSNTDYGNGGLIRMQGTTSAGKAGDVEIKGGTFSENSATRWGGFLYSTPDTTVTISGGIFKNNTATNGGAIYSNGTIMMESDENSSIEIFDNTLDAIYVTSDSTATMKDVKFTGETLQIVHIDGSLNFNNITGATIVQGAEATLNVAGYESTNVITVTPSAYTAGTQILRQADGLEDITVFQNACASIQVTADADGGEWIIDSVGKLQKPYAARIGETLYATFVEAIDDAKTNGGTGSVDDIVVYVRQDLQISELKITQNIKIQNELGIDVTIEPSVVGKQMFIVNTGAKLTLGTNENTEGQLSINGATSTIAASRIVQNLSGATFVLGRNATLQNANYNGWGTALNNAGKAELYGNVINNISKAAGGAILQSNANAELIIYEGNYSGNQATRTSTVSQGSAIIANGGTVTIKGGMFFNNITTGAGGAIYVYTKTTVTISGGTFTGNTAGTDGNAIYIASGGTVNVTGGIFSTEEPAQEIYVEGTLNYNNVPEALIKGTGTKINTSQTK